MNYRIYKQNAEYVGEYDLDEEQIEMLSSESAEGFFMSGQVDELADEIGDIVVYAIVT